MVYSCEDFEILEKSFNKWRFKCPIYWTKVDSFCWLFDWSSRNNVKINELEHFYKLLPKATILIELNLEFFTKVSDQHGLKIYEDLQLIISSSNRFNKIKYKDFPITYNMLKLNKTGKKNGLRIWQFLFYVLLDSETNPDIIKWINYSQGIFLIVDRDKIAELWGYINNNRRMTYENMSRSIRYCYKYKYVEAMEENFTYRFGPSSYEWIGKISKSNIRTLVFVKM